MRGKFLGPYKERTNSVPACTSVRVYAERSKIFPINPINYAHLVKIVNKASRVALCASLSRFLRYKEDASSSSLQHVIRDCALENGFILKLNLCKSFLLHTGWEPCYVKSEVSNKNATSINNFPAFMFLFRSAIKGRNSAPWVARLVENHPCV